jgi:hypothetical protein
MPVFFYASLNISKVMYVLLLEIFKALKCFLKITVAQSESVAFGVLYIVKLKVLLIWLLVWSIK